MILILAMICQWLGWFFKVPSLVLLLITGILLGPIFHIVEPLTQDLHSLEIFVSLGVAIILFEGGLQLKLQELYKIPKSIIKMTFPGAFISWILISLGAYYIANFSLGISIFLGAILVVTGPTVIIPLLRQNKPSSKVASVLKWEGIINDPIGALMATITALYLINKDFQINSFYHFSIITVAILGIIIISYLISKVISLCFINGRMPEFLKPPVMLSFLILSYALGNYLQKEGGLIAVTVLGISLANTKSIRQDSIHKFVEFLTIILVSLIFIILTSTLQFRDIYNIDINMILFVIALIFIIRPLSVMISTYNTELNIKEKIFIGLIGPRGVVCVAVSGLFAPLLTENGYIKAELLTPCIFLIVFSSVIFSGFCMKPLGKLLGVITPHENELLIVGANPFTMNLAQTLLNNNIQVKVMDHTWRRLKIARCLNIPTLYGEILSLNATHSFEIDDITHILASSGNSAYNALVCSKFAHELGEQNVTQLAFEKDETNDNWTYHSDIKGKILYSDSTNFDFLINCINNGWKFSATKLTEVFSYEDYQKLRGEEENIIILKVSEKGLISFAISDIEMKAKSGDTIISLSKSE